MSKPYFTLTIYKFSDRLWAGSDSAFVSTAAELEFNWNPAIDVAADCLAAPRRNFEADSAAPLDHVQVAAVRAAVAAGRRHSVLCFSHDDACTAVRVRQKKKIMVCTGTKIKDFFMVILIPKLSLNFRTS